MKKRLVIISTVILVMFMLFIGVSSVQNKSALINDVTVEDNQKYSTIMDENIVIYDQNDEDIVFETEYCNLYYPGSWVNVISMEIIDDKVVFWGTGLDGSKQVISELIFGSAEGDIVEVVLTELNQKMDVALRFTDFSNKKDISETNLERFYAMQDDMNYLMDNLPIADKVFLVETNETDGETEHDDFEIVTPFGKLYYPAKWSDKLYVENIETDVYTVKFYCVISEDKKYHLFDMIFGGDNTDLCVVVKDSNGEVVNVNVIPYSVNDYDNLTSDEKDLIYAMQEQMNYILSNEIFEQ